MSGDSLVNGATIYYYDGLLTGEEISYTNNYATAVVLITEPVTYIPGTPTLPGGTTYTPIPLPTPVVPTPYLPTLPYEEPKTMVQVIRKMIDNTFDYISETTEHFIAPQALPNT